MKHGKKGNHLGRKVAHRKSMLANMACSLIEHKRINTTVAKAKALKQFVEPLITKSKTDTTHNRRLAFSALRNKYAVSELFRDVAQKVGDRPGGYTRVIKMGNRLGDNADMAMIELVDFNTVYNADKAEAKKTTRRSRSRKKSGSAATPEAQAETPAAEVAETAAAPAPEASQPEEKKSEEQTDDKSSKTDKKKDA
jgi:large subunit ribosomal protein L17